jgi:hypothetical protein
MSKSWTEDDYGSAGKSWINPAGARLDVVFVHGFQGDHLSTWTHTAKRKLTRPWKRRESTTLFSLLMEDPGDPPECNYHSVGHQAGIRSPTDLEAASGVIRTFLRSYVAQHGNPIALVAHSFGGLACRMAILSTLEDPKDRTRIVGLLMMGTPNRGTEIARAASALGSKAGSDMKPFDRRLAALNRDWTRHVVNGGDPDWKPAERAPLVCWAALGTEDKVVPAASASALASFSDIERLAKGHIELVKARDHSDPTYALTLRFIRTALQAAYRYDGDWALKHLTHRLRRATLRGRWVRREEVHIRLRRTGGPPHVLGCDVRDIRVGGLARSRFTIAVWISGHRPQGPIDLDWELGKGVLSKDDFGRFAAGVEEDLDHFFKVERLWQKQGDVEGEMRLARRETGPAWSLLHFEAPEGTVADEPCDRLEIEFSTIVDRRQGWFYFGLPRTLSDGLSVTFRAPFEYGVVSRLGVGSRVSGPTSIGEDYLTEARAPGPVPIGRTMVWVYSPGEEPGDETGEERDE